MFLESNYKMGMNAYYCDSASVKTSDKSLLLEKHDNRKEYGYNDSRATCYDYNDRKIAPDSDYCRYNIATTSDWFNLGIEFPEHNLNEYQLNYSITDNPSLNSTLTVEALALPSMNFKDALGLPIYSVALPAGRSFKVNWFQSLIYMNIPGQDYITAKVMMKVNGAQPEWQDAPSPFSSILNSRFYGFALNSEFVINTSKIDKITQPVELKIVFSYKNNGGNRIFNNEFLVFLIPNNK
jgi:hypothetical protein